MPSPVTAHQASTLSEHRFKSHLRCFASGSLLNALGGTEGAQGKNVPYQKMMQDLNIFCIKTNLPFHWVSRLASQVLSDRTATSWSAGPAQLIVPLAMSTGP